MNTMTATPATAKQIAFARRLYVERYPAENIDEMVEIFSSLTSRNASITIDNLLSMPRQRRQQTPSRPAVTEPGMYRKGDDFYRVQRSRGSGNLYAKRLVVSEFGKGHFEYASGAIFGLSDEDRMSVEEAKQFGFAYGICCVCSAELSDPKSVAAGIGPVCAKRV